MKSRVDASFTFQRDATIASAPAWLKAAACARVAVPAPRRSRPEASRPGWPARGAARRPLAWPVRGDRAALQLRQVAHDVGLGQEAIGAGDTARERVQRQVKQQIVRDE